MPVKGDEIFHMLEQQTCELSGSQDNTVESLSSHC